MRKGSGDASGPIGGASRAFACSPACPSEGVLHNARPRQAICGHLGVSATLCRGRCRWRAATTPAQGRKKRQHRRKPYESTETRPTTTAHRGTALWRAPRRRRHGKPGHDAAALAEFRPKFAVSGPKLAKLGSKLGRCRASFGGNPADVGRATVGLIRVNLGQTRSMPGRIRPMSGQIWPNSGQIWSTSGQVLSNLGQRWPNLADAGPILVGNGPLVAVSGPLWVECLSRAIFGRSRPECGRMWAYAESADLSACARHWCRNGNCAT